MSGIGRTCVRSSPLLSWLPGLVCLVLIDQCVYTCLGDIGQGARANEGRLAGIIRTRFCGSIGGDDIPSSLFFSDVMVRMRNGGNRARFLVLLLCVRLRSELSQCVKCQKNDLAPWLSAAEGACVGQP